jgi:hypothetical protein
LEPLYVMVPLPAAEELPDEVVKPPGSVMLHEVLDFVPAPELIKLHEGARPPEEAPEFGEFKPEVFKLHEGARPPEQFYIGDMVVPLDVVSLPKFVQMHETAKLHDKVMQPKKFPDKVVEPLYVMVPLPVKMHETAKLPDKVMQPEKLPDKVVEPLYVMVPLPVAEELPGEVVKPPGSVMLHEVLEFVPAPELIKLHEGARPPEEAPAFGEFKPEVFKMHEGARPPELFYIGDPELPKVVIKKKNGALRAVAARAALVPPHTWPSGQCVCRWGRLVLFLLFDLGFCDEVFARSTEAPAVFRVCGVV